MTPSYDGLFFYGVRTTKIYCRPSCRSKTPLKENVLTHPSSSYFIHLNFRACKRCRPGAKKDWGPKLQLINQAKELIHERYNEDLTLKALSSMLYISPYYFRKIFEELEGKSPSRYVLETRINAAMPLIKEGSYSIMDISRMTGFKTPSHFSRVFQRVTGAPPSYYRQKVPQ